MSGACSLAAALANQVVNMDPAARTSANNVFFAHARMAATSNSMRSRTTRAIQIGKMSFRVGETSTKERSTLLPLS
jgi:hypothetical protein